MANSLHRSTPLNLVSVLGFEQQSRSGRIVSLTYSRNYLKGRFLFRASRSRLWGHVKEGGKREREGEKGTPKASSGQGGLPETKAVVQQWWSDDLSFQKEPQQICIIPEQVVCLFNCWVIIQDQLASELTQFLLLLSSSSYFVCLVFWRGKRAGFFGLLLLLLFFCYVFCFCFFLLREKQKSSPKRAVSEQRGKEGAE